MPENTVNYPNGADVRGVIGVFQYTSTVFGIVHYTTGPVNLYVDFVQVGNLSSGTPTVTRVKHVLVNSNSYFTTTVPPIAFSSNAIPGFGYDAKYLGSNRFAILYRGVFTGDSPFALATTAFTINPTTYEVSGDGSGYRATPPTNHTDSTVAYGTWGFARFNLAPIGTAGTEYWITSPHAASPAQQVGCRRINTSTYTASYTSSGYGLNNALYDVSGGMITATEDGAGIILCTHHDSDTSRQNVGPNVVSIRNSDNNETAIVTIDASGSPVTSSPSDVWLGPTDSFAEGDDFYVVAETLTKWSGVFHSQDTDRFYHLEYDGGTFTRSYLADGGTSAPDIEYRFDSQTYPVGYRKLDADHYVFVTNGNVLTNSNHYYHFVQINNGKHLIQRSVGSATANASGVLGRNDNTYPSTDSYLFKIDSTTLLLFMTGGSTTPAGTYTDGATIRVIRPT